MAVTNETAWDLRELVTAVDLLTHCRVLTVVEEEALQAEVHRFVPYRPTVGIAKDVDAFLVGDLRLDVDTAIAVAGKSIERAYSRLFARFAGDEEWEQLLELARLATRKARVAALKVGVARLGVAAGIRRPPFHLGLDGHAAHPNVIGMGS